MHADPTECQDGVTNDCTHTCTRTVSNGSSSYECGCDEGYELSLDNATCEGMCVCDETLYVVWVKTAIIVDDYSAYASHD